tara:strand:- start:422 stop:598 length:177 start_codon:yes stop_codon:yes gene_type:complete
MKKPMKSKGYRSGGKVKKMSKGGAAGGKKVMRMSKGGSPAMTLAQVKSAAKALGKKVV